MQDFSGGSDGKAFTYNVGDLGLIPGLGRSAGDTKGTFHVKMGSIKDRNGMDLTEAEDIKKGGKNTQKN